MERAVASSIKIDLHVSFEDQKVPLNSKNGHVCLPLPKAFLAVENQNDLQLQDKTLHIEGVEKEAHFQPQTLHQMTMEEVMNNAASLRSGTNRRRFLSTDVVVAAGVLLQPV